MIEDRIGSVRTGPQLFFSFQYSIPVLLSTPWPTKSLRNARSAPFRGSKGCGGAGSSHGVVDVRVDDGHDREEQLVAQHVRPVPEGRPERVGEGQRGS